MYDGNHKDEGGTLLSRKARACRLVQRRDSLTGTRQKQLCVLVENIILVSFRVMSSILAAVCIELHPVDAKLVSVHRKFPPLIALVAIKLTYGDPLAISI